MPSTVRRSRLVPRPAAARRCWLPQWADVHRPCGSKSHVVGLTTGAECWQAADELDCVRCGAGAHFFWGAVTCGYLLYDTAFTLLFWRAVGAPAFLAHHALGLACCAFGLYGNRCP